VGAKTVRGAGLWAPNLDHMTDRKQTGAGVTQVTQWRGNTVLPPGSIWAVKRRGACVLRSALQPVALNDAAI